MAADAKDIKDRYNQLKTERGTLDAHYDEIIDFIMPFRQSILSQGPVGRKKMDKVLDSTPTHSLILSAAGIYGMLTNPAMDWFNITTENDEIADVDEVKYWCHDLKKRYINLFNKSNFYSQIHEVYIDIMGFGMGPMYVMEHPRTLCYFQSVSPGETYISANRYGEVDTVYRPFKLTARQMLQWWGMDKMPDKVKGTLDKKPFEMYDVIHALYPRNDRKDGMLDKENKPWASCYVETSETKKLSESGFDELPCMIPRFFVASGEVYGRGPGMLALPDVKMLNQMESDVLKAGRKKLSPPLLVPSDGFVGPLMLVPNGVNFFRADQRMTMQEQIGVFPVPDDLGYAEQKLQQKREQIKQIFYNDMLQLIEQTHMSVPEVLQRIEEKLRLLGPFMGRVNSELNNPMFDRIFNIMLRNGQVPMPPPILQGQALKIDYVNPLAKAQRAAEADGIARTFAFITPVVQAGMTEPLDVIDIDGGVKAFAEISGYPIKSIRSDEEIAKIRATREQAMQKEKMGAQLMEAAKTIPALSKEAGAGSIMEKLMGAGEKPGTQQGTP